MQTLTVKVPSFSMPPASPLAIVNPERLAVWPASTVTIREENETPAARSTVSWLASGPLMAMLLFRSGSGLCRSMLLDTVKPIVNLSEWLPASAARIAIRRVPGPESAKEVTDRLICAGTQRHSSASSVGRRAGRLRGAPCCFWLCSQEENPMMLILSRNGLP